MLNRYLLGQEIHNIEERINVLENTALTINTDNATINKSLNLSYATPQTLLYIDESKNAVSMTLSDLIFPVVNQTIIEQNLDNSINIGTAQDIGISSIPTFGGVAVNGDISITGTVDGVDVSSLNNMVTNHINNNTTAHFGQDLKTTGSPTFNKITLTQYPSLNSDAATKQYVDLHTGRRDWQDSVIEVYDPTGGLPVLPSNGDRYLSADTVFGWTKDYIYEWQDTVWLETVPNDGFVVFVSGGLIAPRQFLVYAAPTTEWLLIEKSLDHQQIIGAGSYTHSQIDSHIDNSTTAHFGQDLKSTGSPTFSAVNVATFPTQTYHLANKSYVDNIVQNIHWQKAVIEYFDPTSGLPVSPTQGDRYISATTANGWTEDYIYEWDSIIFWIETIPEAGYALYVEGGLINPQTCITYNGVDWVKFSSTLDHTTLINIGVNTHSQIDSHISNDTNAHFGQDLKITASPQFTELTITSTTNSSSTTTGAIKINGGVGIAQELSSNTIHIYGTIQSTTSTTGALIIDGGVGIKENVNIGGLTTFTSSVNSTDTLTGSIVVSGGMAIQQNLTSEFINVASTTNATDFTTGALHIEGGVSIKQSLYVSNTINSTFLNVLSTNNATDSLSGGLHVYGGASIEQDVYVGGTLYASYSTIEKLTITSTENSTSSTTGALQVVGGIGVGGSLYVNNTSTFSKVIIAVSESTSSSSTGSLQVSGGSSLAGIVHIYNTTLSTDTLMGALIVDGGVAIQQSTNIGQNLTINGTTTSQDINIIATTESTDVISGALKVAGGVGIEGDVHIGGTLDVTGFTTVPSLTVTTLINSTSTSTGSVIVYGGVGIGQNVNIGGQMQVDNISTFQDWVVLNSTQESSDISSGALQVAGGAGIKHNLNVGGSENILGSLNVYSTSDTTNLETGSVIVAGGVAIQKNLYVGGITDIIGTTTIHDPLIVIDGTPSTSTTTGSLIVSGGVAIGKNINIGGNINASGTLTSGSATVYGIANISDITTILSTITSSDTLSGALQVKGGASFGSDVYIGNSITAVGSTFDTTNIVSTIESTSTNTGALQLTGGAGIAGNLNVGGSISTNSSLNAFDITIIATTDSSNTATGALKVAGGVGIGKSLNVGIDATISNNLTTTFANIISTDDATNTTSGAIHIYGGATIDKRLIVKNEIITSTLNATDTLTGALQVAGGVAISQDIIVGGLIQTDTIKIISTIPATDTLTGSMIVSGGASVQGDLYVGGEVHASGLTFDNAHITSTTNSSSTTTGALIVSGGVGIGQTVFIGENLNVLNTTFLNVSKVLSTDLSSSTSTGALQVVGGAGIGSLFVAGTSTLNSSTILNGSLTMGSNDIVSVGTITSSENIITTLTETSTSTSTGALRVAGGGSFNSLYIDSTVSGTTSSVGAIIVKGGIGVGGGINVAGTSEFTGTVIAPTQLYHDNTTKVATTAYVDNSIFTQNSIAVSPNGFENTTDSIISYNSGTRVFTLSPTYTSFNVWVAGVRYTVSSPIVMTAHAAVAGTTYYYYFDDTGTLQVVNSFPAIYNSAMVAFVYYYSSSIYLVAEERHGTVMDQATHFELHQTVGTYYISGLAAADYTIDPVTPTDTDNNFSIDTGVISDEQLNSTISATTAGGPYTVLQLTGSSSLWTWTLANTSPFYYQSGSYIQYNQNNAGSWQLTTLSDNNWVNYYVCFAPSLDATTQTLIIPGQAVYTSLVDAQAESFYNLTIGSLPFPEFLPLYKITFRTSSGYTTTGQCRIESWTRIVGNRVNIYNNTASNHQALSGLQLAGPGVTYGHVTDQLQSFAGVKKFIDTSDSTTTTTGGIVVSGGVGVAKDIYVGQHVVLVSTETSSSTSTGALQVVGGAGLGSLYVAGTVTTASNIINTLTETSSSTSTGSLRVNGGASLGQLYVDTTTTLNGNLTMGTNDIVSVGTITSSENIITTLTENTASTSTGALRVYGGVGIAKNLYVGGAVLSYNNNELMRTSFSNVTLGIRATSTWTPYSNSLATTFDSICWSPELGIFCAVSAAGPSYVSTSPNGITWTSRSSDNRMWKGVCWSPELSLFCAVGYNGTGDRVMTSPDGITWTTRVSAADNQWYNVCWSPELGLFCAIAGMMSGTGNRVMISPDGVNWTTQNNPVDNDWRSICWSPELGMFCAVSVGGSGNNVMTSTDGITWTSRSSSTNSWKNICWSAELGLFCIAGLGSTDQIATSPDGITWTTRTTPTPFGDSTICWSSELGLFCGISSKTMFPGSTIFTSPDGITWTSRTENGSYWRCNICWSSELGIFCSAGGSNVIISKKVYNSTSRQYIKGIVTIDSSVNSTSSSTGALTVIGGVGIGNNLYVGGNTTISGTTSFNGDLALGTNDIVSVGTITSSENIIVTSTETSSSTSTGALRVLGGGSFNSLYIDSTITGTTSNVGAIIVNGGIGVGGGINVAGTSEFTGTVIAPTQTYRDNSTKVATTAYVDNSLFSQNSARSSPTGFENRTDSTISYDSGTRILSISPASTSFNVWIAGIRYTISTTLSATAHADTAGTIYFYYIDDSLTLQKSSSYPLSYNIAMVAYIYYYSSTIYILAEERHGTIMDPATRLEFHQTIGTYYVSGLAASNFTLNPSSPTDSHNNYSIDTGVISDEQLNCTISATTAGGPYTVLQLTGSGVWTWTTNNTSPFYYQTSSYIQYNQYTGGAWQLTPLSNDTWVNYYIVFTESVNASTQTLIIPGQTTYASLLAAQGENFYNLTLDGLIFPEFLPLYQITFRASSTYTSTGQCRIEAWTRLVGTSVSIVNNTATNHQSLSGLQLTGTAITYGHISDQSQTILGIKTFGDTSDSTSSASGSVIIEGGLGLAKDLFVGKHVIIEETSNSSSTSTGALRVVGGSSLGQLYVDTTTTFNGSLTMGTNDIISVGTITSSESIITTATDGSSSTSTGALQVIGGAGIGNLFVAGTTTLNSSAFLNGSLTMGVNDIVSVGSITSSENIITTLTDGSSSTSTGALQVIGGAGLGSLYVNGSSTLNSSIVMNGSLTMGVNDIVSVGTITSSENIITTLTETSSSTSTGALRVVGGAGLGSLYVDTTTTMNGNLTMGVNDIVSVGTITSSENIITTLTENSTSISTGALRVSGGVGIAENLYIGGTVLSFNNNELMRKSFSNVALGTRAVSTWTTQTCPSAGWFGLCWSAELGMFCAVASSGSGDRVMTSSDGINWTTRVSAADNNWNNICWSPELGLFCAVAISGGSGNRVMTSPDGITWTTQTSPVDNWWCNICWSPELGLFCAIAFAGMTSGNYIMTSPDGIIWTTRNNPVDNMWRGICWSPELGLFCAVSEGFGSGDRVMISSDGIIWTTQTSALDNNWQGVCWSPELGLFCAVGTGMSHCIMTSPDGIIWTSRITPTSNSWSKICWSPELGLFCAVAIGFETGNYIMTSPDGIIWTTQASAADNTWNNICWSPELGIFCSTSFNVMISKHVYDSTSRQLIKGIVTIDSSVNSSSTSTGALKVIGGAGIGGNLSIGGNTTISGTTTLNGNLALGTNDITSVGTITSSENIIITATETSSSTATGALRVYGGVGVNQLYVASTTTLNGNLQLVSGSLTMGTNDIVSVGTITSSENIITTATDGSSSTSTGALRVYGGAGMESLYVNSNTTLNSGAYINGNITMGSNDIVSIGAITSSGVISSTTTIKTTDPTLSTSTSSGALQVSGGAGLGQLYVAGDATIAGTLSAGTLTFSELELGGTANSTSTSTGTLVVHGGVGIYQDVHIGGALVVSGDINSGYSASSQSFTGPCTLTATLTCYKIGHLTLINFPNTTDTVTSSTYFTGSGIIPVGFRPVSDVRKMIFVKDNNIEIVGSCTITSDGNVIIYTGSNGNFTLSGIAGFSLDLEYIN